jgi:hypothetical protein
VVQHLPTLLEERLDLLHGPLVERRTRTAPLEISVREDGSDLVFGVRVGGKPLQDAERAVASGIEPRGERFVVTEFTSAEVETLKDILRRLAALRRGGGEFAVAMIPTLMFVLREEWPALIRLGTVEVAPSLRPLLQGELELRATLTLRDDGRFTDAGVLWYAGDVALTDHEVRDLARSHGGFLRSRSGTWFRADPTQVQAVVREIEGLGLDTGASTRLLRPEARSLLEKIPADANLALADSAQPLAERILRTPLDPPLALPEHLEPVLRPYQKHGFEFLSDRQRYRVGAVLADDMGLGKTLQVLSLLEAFYASGPRAHSGAERLRSLVICPASVVMVWVQQAALFCPGLRCRAYQGNPETRAEILGADDWDVLVLNYALARNDSEALLGAAYQFVVLDEAQQIKNPDSQIAQVSPARRWRTASWTCGRSWSSSTPGFSAVARPSSTATTTRRVTSAWPTGSAPRSCAGPRNWSRRSFPRARRKWWSWRWARNRDASTRPSVSRPGSCCAPADPWRSWQPSRACASSAVIRTWCSRTARSTRPPRSMNSATGSRNSWPKTIPCSCSASSRRC